MEELFYTIDQELTESTQTLVIKIQIGERHGLCHLAQTSGQHLSEETLLRLASARDNAILPFLLKEERAFIKKNRRGKDNNHLFYIVHIPFSLTSEIFKLFAVSGRLYFHEKQLTIDLFGKNEFFYFVDTSKESPTIKGCIKTVKETFDLNECDFVCKGNSNWFIKGVLLKFITNDVSWKDLSALAKLSPRPLQELVEEAGEDTEAPQVIFSGPNIQIKEQEPLPILMLQDRQGAFANLWMDYGSNTPLLAFEDPTGDVRQTGGGLECKRQRSIESGWEKDLLETGFTKKTVDSSHYYCPVDKVAKSIAFLVELGWNVRDSKGNRVHFHTDTELKTKTDSKTITITGKLHYGTFQADLTEIIGAFSRRERFAEITPGHVALLPDNWEGTGFDAFLEEGEIVGDTVQIPTYSMGALSSLFTAQPNLGIDNDLKEMKEKLESFQGIKQASVSSLFNGSLRPYQQEGLNWLSYLFDYNFHGLLADDMGLGKTVQVLAFISQLTLLSPVLIIVPTSLIFNWKREIERFLPGYLFTIHHGKNRSSSIEELDKPQLIITTYTTVRLDFSLFSKLSLHCLILDEAQMIKNAHSQTAQTVRLLTSRFRLSITGTPIENHLMELWSHFHFLNPSLFGTEDSFKKEILASTSDPRFLKRIQKKIRPFFLRRRKEEVAKDLPEKIEQTVFVEMGDQQRSVYEQFLSGIRQNLIKKVDADGVSKHRMEILEAIMRLRQICCHPLLVNAYQDKTCFESAKLDILMEDLETAVSEGRKVLIYSQFTSMLSLIGKRVKEKDFKFAYLDGSTKDREKVVTEFQENQEIPLFLISLKAGGIGLNLTAADYVFLYDPWWNNAVEEQAIDRAHRIGRKGLVIAKRYIVQESIEEKMMKLKAAKSSLAAGLLDEEFVSKNLSAEDLLFLLS